MNQLSLLLTRCLLSTLWFQILISYLRKVTPVRLMFVDCLLKMIGRVSEKELALEISEAYPSLSTCLQSGKIVISATHGDQSNLLRI